MDKPESISPSFEAALQEAGYNYIKELGEGGFSNVYLVFSNKYDQLFAVKAAKGDTTFDLLNEMNTLMELDHPNIIRLYSRQVIDLKDCLFLEYCQGGTLSDLLREESMIEPPRLYSFCFQIALAVEFMHSKSISHKDIKPANVLIDKYGRLKLTDFGMASISRSTDNYQCGTRNFMAPELWDQEPSKDRYAADVFALGVTFYFLASGKVPCLQEMMSI